MRNLIYQYWTGNVPYYIGKSVEMMREYAKSIGAEYRVDINDNFFSGSHAQYSQALRPIHDTEFHKYDNVLFCDMDIFTKATENIFEEPNQGFSMAEEIGQTVLREHATGPINGTQDKIWRQHMIELYNSKVPLDEKGRVITFNTGVVMYTQEALSLAKDNWIDYETYVKDCRRFFKFYQIDQNYLNAMAFMGPVKFTQLDGKWNSQLYYIGNKVPRDILDNRTEETQFVHCQLRGRDSLTDDKIYDIMYKDVDNWRHRND